MFFKHTELFIENLKWRREIFVAMLYLDDGIQVNSASFANEETWFVLIGTAGRTFSYTLVEFAEAAGTELCKGNVEEIANIELDCTAMRNNPRLSLTVKCINVFGFTTFYLCCHP